MSVSVLPIDGLDLSLLRDLVNVLLQEQLDFLVVVEEPDADLLEVARVYVRVDGDQGGEQLLLLRSGPKSQLLIFISDEPLTLHTPHISAIKCCNRN